MNWKRLLRSSLCLLVAFAIFLNCFSVKADATAAGLVVAGKVAFDAVNVIAAILIGLGVSVGLSQVDWDDLKTRVLDDLQEKGYVDANGKFHLFTVDGTNHFYNIHADVITAVRSLLFAEGFLSSETVVESDSYYAETLFSGRSLKTAFCQIAYSYPAEFVACLSTLGINYKTMIIGCSDDYLYGFHFDDAGLFVRSTFKNPLRVANASLIGVRLIENLELVSASVPVRTISAGGLSSSDTYRSIYFSKAHAEKVDGFLTSNVAAFDFSGIPYYGVYDSLYNNSSIFFRFSLKQSANTVWNESTSAIALSPSDLGSLTVSAPEGDAVVWESLSKVVVTSPYDFTLENVADDDIPLVDAYPLWSAGAITVPGAEVGSDDEEVHLYPLGLSPTLPGTESMSQADVWTGATSSTVPDAGTAPDSISNVGATTFWDTLKKTIASIFIPSQDYLTAKVDALASYFPFVAPIVTLARTISLGFDVAEPEPPIIYLHLEDTRGSYNLGGTVPFIDMSWYAEYKPIGDALLSSLLWVVFIWRQFRQLPGLISGMPGEFNSRVLDVLHISLPSRSMATEVQRQRIKETVRKEAKKK